MRLPVPTLQVVDELRFHVLAEHKRVFAIERGHRPVVAAVAVDRFPVARLEPSREQIPHFSGDIFLRRWRYEIVIGVAVVAPYAEGVVEAVHDHF